jgi:hypothetical protein
MKHKHKFLSDGGGCIHCNKTVMELLEIEKSKEEEKLPVSSKGKFKDGPSPLMEEALGGTIIATKTTAKKSKRRINLDIPNLPIMDK